MSACTLGSAGVYIVLRDFLASKKKPALHKLWGQFTFMVKRYQLVISDCSLFLDLRHIGRNGGKRCKEINSSREKSKKNFIVFCCWIILNLSFLGLVIFLTD